MLVYEDEWGSGINGHQFLTPGAVTCEWRALPSWEKQGYSIVRSPVEFCNWSQVAAPVDSLLPYPATRSDSFIHYGKKCNVCSRFVAVIDRYLQKLSNFILLFCSHNFSYKSKIQNFTSVSTSVKYFVRGSLKSIIHATFSQLTVSELIYINKEVRQVRGLSPVLVNIYINKIIQEFKIVIKKGTKLSNRKLVNTILRVYADDKILIATSEMNYKQWHITWNL